MLFTNPSIFTKKDKYEYLYQRMNVIREEMMMKCMHPSRLERLIEMGMILMTSNKYHLYKIKNKTIKIIEHKTNKTIKNS